MLAPAVPQGPTRSLPVVSVARTFPCLYLGRLSCHAPGPALLFPQTQEFMSPANGTVTDCRRAFAEAAPGRSWSPKPPSAASGRSLGPMSASRRRGPRLLAGAVAAASSHCVLAVRLAELWRRPGGGKGETGRMEEGGSRGIGRGSLGLAGGEGGAGGPPPGCLPGFTSVSSPSPPPPPPSPERLS